MYGQSFAEMETYHIDPNRANRQTISFFIGFQLYWYICWIQVR